MEVLGTITTGRAVTRPKDHRTTTRRAYLDNYARTTRTGVSQQAVTQVTTLAAVDPVVSTVQQPAYVPPAAFDEIPEEVVVPVEAPEAVIAPPAPQGLKQYYIDTLIRHHKTAVAASPQSLETQEELTPTETTELLEEEIPVGEETKISANLRALYEDTPLTDALAKDIESASISHVRTIITSALACGVLSVGIFTFLARVDSQPIIAQPIGAPVIEVEAPAAQPASTNTPVSTEINRRIVADPSHPVRVVISKLGVNAPVEGYGVTADGLIAVPESWGVVGWYNKGVAPGQNGPAVLVGHYSGSQGAIFDKLGSLEDGDLITVTNGRGENFSYKVTKKAEYHRDQVPMADLFKKSDHSRLEIITCAGQWQADNYDNRLVVTADLIR